MLDEIGSPALKIVYDAANLLDPDGYDSAAAAARSPATSTPWDRTSRSGTPRNSSPTAPRPLPARACCPGP
jgi:hypothetical protein